jgi:hypothetical protein
MTAEIASLNKSAVALAADSAVTISTGDRDEKTFDSADKLFELCRHNSIAVMVYNGLGFAEAPLQSLIKRYRGECQCFATVKDAGYNFLEYLNGFGKSASSRVKDDAIRFLVSPVLKQMASRFEQAFQQHFMKAQNQPQQSPPPANAVANVQQIMASILDNVIAVFDRVYQQAEDARFVGGGLPTITPHMEGVLQTLVENQFGVASPEQKARLLAIAKLILHKNKLSGGATGIVIAGFGSNELFPTLISFEIDGMVGDQLKFVDRNFIDIDRDGEKARVIPFAQKEMVDRFLYGLDDGIERNITTFCLNTVSDIRKSILNHLQFPTLQDQEDFDKTVSTAEDAFIDGLKSKAFDVIRTNSKISIDAMVEFMPKPEMAKMAEALVNLTSIKKRVTRGMDTVGGPIDVAVISQAEGFVWVKRKHYFPADLNQRYVARVGDRVRQDEDHLHEQKSRPRPRPPARVRKAARGPAPTTEGGAGEGNSGHSGQD